MKGARALAGGVVVLVLICALPAVSAAQDPGAAGGGGASTTTTDPSNTPTQPVDPGTSTAPSSAPGAPSGGPAAGTPGEPQDGSRTASTVIGGSPPADGPSVGAKAHKSSDVTVRMGDFFFSASSVTIHAGDIVTWRNIGNAPHTATANDGSFDTGTVTSGQTASHMFTTPGTFTYVCTIHPNMHGTIHVLAAAGSGGGGSSGSSASSSSSGQSETQAVNSPNAAANSSHLAATGMAVGGLAFAGLLMLATGLAVKQLGRREPATTPVAVPRLTPSSAAPAPGSAALPLALLVRRRSRVLVLLLALLLPLLGLRFLGRQG